MAIDEIIRFYGEKGTFVMDMPAYCKILDYASQKLGLKMTFDKMIDLMEFLKDYPDEADLLFEPVNLLNKNGEHILTNYQVYCANAKDIVRKDTEEKLLTEDLSNREIKLYSLLTNGIHQPEPPFFNDSFLPKRVRIPSEAEVSLQYLPRRLDIYSEEENIIQ